MQVKEESGRRREADKVQNAVAKQRMCEGLQDLDLRKRERGGEKKKLRLFVCGVPCDSWRNAVCDSDLCIVSRQRAPKNGDDV